MVETEMSIQSEKILTNATSSYSKIETNENCYIDPKDIKLGIYTKDLNDDDDPSKEIPSAQLLPISIEQRKTFEYAYPLYDGENKLEVRVYNESDVSEVFKAKVNK